MWWLDYILAYKVKTTFSSSVQNAMEVKRKFV